MIQCLPVRKTCWESRTERPCTRFSGVQYRRRRVSVYLTTAMLPTMKRASAATLCTGVKLNSTSRPNAREIWIGYWCLRRRRRSTSRCQMSIATISLQCRPIKAIIAVAWSGQTAWSSSTAMAARSRTWTLWPLRIRPFSWHGLFLAPPSRASLSVSISITAQSMRGNLPLKSPLAAVNWNFIIYYFIVLVWVH